MHSQEIPEDALSQRARSLIEKWLLSVAAPQDTSVATLISSHPELRSQLESEWQKLQRIEGVLGSNSPALGADASLLSNGNGIRFQIPGYRIANRVGAGGQASVFRGTQVSTGQTVAIKAIYGGALCSEAAKKRFDREVRILVELNHPYIANVIDRGFTDEGTPFVVIRFVEGQNLDEWLQQRRNPESKDPSRAEVHELLAMFLTICDTVHAAHQKGIVHRDLKPSNIRMDQRGQPYILDFGLALEVIMDADAGGASDPAAARTRTGQFVGSLPWASPEQIGAVEDPVGERSDVYALGLILYDMLAGCLPFESTMSLRELLRDVAPAVKVPPSVRKRLTFPRAERCAISPVLDAIVLKAIALHPRDRYATAGELAADLQAYLDGRPTTAAAPRYPRRAVLTIYAVLATSLILLAAWLLPRLALFDPPASVRGTVWRDDNGDGLMQADEPGLAGATVYADLNANGKLDDGPDVSRPEPSAVADQRGEYVLRLGKMRSVIRCQVSQQVKATFPQATNSPRDIFTIVGTQTLRRLNPEPGQLPDCERGQDFVFDVGRQVPAIAAFLAESTPMSMELDALDGQQLVVGWVQQNRSSPFTYLARVIVDTQEPQVIYVGSLPIERDISDVGDIDGDGRLDMLVRSREGVPNAEANWHLQVCWGKADGTFDLSTPLQPVALNQRSITTWLEDVNGDGLLDVLYHLTKWGGYFTFELKVALGQGDGTFRFDQSQTLLRGPANHGLISFRPTDLDGDGDRDLLLFADDDTGDEGQTYVAIRNGDGGYDLRRFIDLEPAIETPGQDRSMASQAEVCDVDQDGDLELLVLESPDRDDRVRLYRHVTEAVAAGSAAENWPYEIVDLNKLWVATVWPRELAHTPMTTGCQRYWPHPTRRTQRLDFGFAPLPPQ